MRWFGACGVIAAVLWGCAAETRGGEADAGAVEAAQARAREIERRVVEQVNHAREAEGLAPLRWDDDVAAAAREHALNMAARRFFSHEDPLLGALRERLERRGVRWSVCAENIFMEQGYADPVPEALKGWLSSAGHRRNILDPRVTRTGTGVALGADGRRYLVQIFIAPQPRGKGRVGRVGS